MRASPQHRIQPNWDFLSPSPAAVEALTRDFGFSYLATPAGFDHVVGVSVVDADGRVYAHVYGDVMTADQLGVPLRRLLRARRPPPAKVRWRNIWSSACASSAPCTTPRPAATAPTTA